jgi:hypothetical protein
MLQLTRPPANRFPSLPFFGRPPKVSPADRRVIRMALRGGGDQALPTDWPALEPLLDLLDQADRPPPERVRRARRTPESAA